MVCLIVGLVSEKLRALLETLKIDKLTVEGAIGISRLFKSPSILENSKFSIVKDEKIFLSLQDIAIDKFTSFGISNIIDIKECTYDNLSYHSYRRNKTNERMKGWIYYNE